MSQIELTYVTVNYMCGCVAARPVRKNDPKLKLMLRYSTNKDSKIISSPKLCDFHQQEYEQEQERRAALQQIQKVARRYIVDGHPMTIYQDKGYWRGRRYEKGKPIVKAFGKADPRPGLEEAWI